METKNIKAQSIEIEEVEFNEEETTENSNKESNKPIIEDFADSLYEPTHRVLSIDDPFDADGRVFTIESVEVSEIKPEDKPIKNNFGEHYEKKLIINFKEPIKEGDLKLKSIMSKVYLNRRKGTNRFVPVIPKPCTKEDWLDDDQYSSEVAKFRRAFYDSYPELEFVELKNGKKRLQTSKEFVTSIIGKKVRLKKVIRKFKDQKTGEKIKIAKLYPIEFIREE